MKYVEGITEIIHYNHCLSKKEIRDIYRNQCIEAQRNERKEKLNEICHKK